MSDYIIDLENIDATIESIQNEDEVVHISKIQTDNKKIPVVSTGYSILDEAMAGGFRPGNLVIITGRSGEGKTTFMQNLCVNISNNGQKCQFFSYEITLQELKEKFEEIDKDLTQLDLYTPKRMTSGNIDWIKKKIIEGQHINIKHFFIDHIDFLTPTNLRDSDQTRTKLKQITTELKSLANELNVCIYLIAHIRKGDATKELEMEDIAESAGIYQLADYVLGVKRDIKTDVYIKTKTDGGARVTILKNRKTGNVTNFLKYKIKNNRTVIIGKDDVETYGQDVEVI